jgi:hypothetical protein
VQPAETNANPTERATQSGNTSRHEDIEVTTVHYRGAHAAAAARSGFSRYSSVSARISARGDTGRGRGGARDPRLAEELLL